MVPTLRDSWGTVCTKLGEKPGAAITLTKPCHVEAEAVAGVGAPSSVACLSAAPSNVDAYVIGSSDDELAVAVVGFEDDLDVGVVSEPPSLLLPLLTAHPSGLAEVFYHMGIFQHLLYAYFAITSR